MTLHCPFLRRLRPRSAFHQIAGPANACALLLTVLFATLGPTLTAPTTPPRSSWPPTSGHASRALLIIVDALRADTATDPAVMPTLCSLASRGGSGVARLDSLIPSTVAGITALTTGSIPGPASFLRDFGSPPEPSGGILQLVHDAGRPTAVAGPPLWSDLFAPWISRFHPEPAWSHSDDATLARAIPAARDTASALVVVHLSACDHAAHLHGARSPQYTDAARAADRAIATLLSDLPHDTCVIITSDHGVTDSGTHAGPEPDVVDTPLILLGPGLPQGPLGTLRQTDVPHLLASALDLPPLTAHPLNPRSIPLIPLRLAILTTAAVAAVRILGSVTSRPPRHFAWLNLWLWPALLLLLLGFFLPSAATATAALITFRTRRLQASAAPPLAAAAIVGVGLAAARLTASVQLPSPTNLAPVIPLIAAPLIGLLAARLLATRRYLSAALLTATLLPPLISGPTLSLSAIPTSTPYSIAADAHGSLTALLIATTIAIMTLALPAALYTIPLAPILRHLPRRPLGLFATCTLTAIATQSFAGGVAFLLATPNHVPLASLSLALLLRPAAELTLISLTFAVTAGSIWIRHPVPNNRPVSQPSAVC